MAYRTNHSGRSGDGKQSNLIRITGAWKAVSKSGKQYMKTARLRAEDIQNLKEGASIMIFKNDRKQPGDDKSPDYDIFVSGDNEALNQNQSYQQQPPQQARPQQPPYQSAPRGAGYTNNQAPPQTQQQQPQAPQTQQQGNWTVPNDDIPW